jgi:hypothetical protein
MRAALHLATLLVAMIGAVACNTIPSVGSPGEVVRDEIGPTRTPVYRLGGMVVLLKKAGEAYPPYAADLRIVPSESERARLGLILHTPQQRYATCGELSLRADDVDLPLRGIEYASTVASNGWMEGWWIDVDVATLAKMAASADSGGTFCGVDWRFDKEQNAVLRKWVAKNVRAH